MLRNKCAIGVVLVTAILSIPGLGQAPPSADAYVTNTRPGTNFGRSPLLPVQAGTSSYIRLNLGLMPPNSSIARATLRLYVNAVVAPGAFDVYQVESPWTERTISFSRAPRLGASATGQRPVEVTAASQDQFLLVDITPLVQSWESGTAPNNGIALVLAGAEGSFSFDSKENAGTGHYPELEISYQPSSEQQSTGATVVTTPPSSKFQVGLSPGDPYVDNGTVLQTGTNFNIDGNGSAATFNATSQFLLAGVPVLGSSGTSGLFLGPGAGQNNSGALNTFLGVSSGQLNTTGSNNTLIGVLAGQNNLTGSNLTFLGTQAGSGNSSGTDNTFVGANAGSHNNVGTYNTYTGSSAGANSIAANYNTYMGYYSGATTRYGSFNTFVGAQSGVFNTDGSSNSMFGLNAGYGNTTGSYNTFLGMNAGINSVSGNHNIYLGYTSGQNADPAANNNIYVASVGAAGESGAIRIGDASNQTAAYVAGVSGSSTNSGVPVFVDSTGKLGTGGGSVSFSQVTGTVSSPQLTGSYGNQVVMSNTTNTFAGSFAGNGFGLTGVNSGLAWPIVTKSADYSVQITDFSTRSTVGNFLVLTGTVSHKFTLPNPAPPNGECVAVGSVAEPTSNNSNTNVILTVLSSPLLIDASLTSTFHPNRAAYLYCSDGSNYYRLGYTQNGVSDIGPWIKTYDTGTVNVMTSTYRNGMEFGITDGTLIYLLPKAANTSNVVTLNLNGLGAYKILKYGNQGLAPGDLSPNAYAQLIWNINGTKWELLNPQTAQGLTGTTPSIGGSLVAAGTCASGTVTVNGATVGHPVSVSASDGSLPNPLIILSGAVTASNTVTVQLCAIAAVTPAAKTFSVFTQ
jgi:hypothetical protein